jgi:hypothetical protein
VVSGSDLFELHLDSQQKGFSGSESLGGAACSIVTSRCEVSTRAAATAGSSLLSALQSLPRLCILLAGMDWGILATGHLINTLQLFAFSSQVCTSLVLESTALLFPNLPADIAILQSFRHGKD